VKQGIYKFREKNYKFASDRPNSKSQQTNEMEIIFLFIFSYSYLQDTAIRSIYELNVILTIINKPLVIY